MTTITKGKQQKQFIFYFFREINIHQICLLFSSVALVDDQPQHLTLQELISCQVLKIIFPFLYILFPKNFRRNQNLNFEIFSCQMWT